MQQIKLIILVLLSICTYFKYRQAQNYNKNKKLQLSVGEAINDVRLAGNNEMQIRKQEYKLLPLDEATIESFAKQQAALFRQHQRAVITPEFSEIIKKSGDVNDIFGGQYQKCKVGKKYEMDPDTILYNGYFTKSQSFFKTSSQSSGFLPSNQDFFANIHQALQSELLYIDEPIFTSQIVQRNSNHNQAILLNNFSNFSFGLNHQDQQLKMDQQLSQSQSQSNLKSKLKQKKRKKILKSSKKYLRIKRDQKKPLKSGLFSKRQSKEKLVNPSKSTKVSKFKKFVCLQQQIKKKQQQLAVLKRLCSSTNDS